MIKYSIIKINNNIAPGIIAVFTLLLCVFLPLDDMYGGSIATTKHNLSVTGPGTIKSTTEPEICIFCHTPHNARIDVPYLWNRYNTQQNYITYESSTLYATVGQPTGASKLCLSCHDGTIALGALVSRQGEVPFAGGIRFLPEGPSRLGTELSDDHPVSFRYDSALALANGELADPALIPPQARLDANNQLQCTACHDPHNDTYGKFLVMSNINSGLCTSCHQKKGWKSSSHETSNATWNGSGANPWQHTPYNTVSNNGCENCHRPHTAGGHARLLQYAFEEDNCLVCHNGNVAGENIQRELIKSYRHAVQDYSGIHEPLENFTSGTVKKHVECADCHNPHSVKSTLSPGAPQISGANQGVKGINTAGQQISEATNLYEICFKCHADYNVITTLPVTRQIAQLNTRLEFDASNPSYHPVETAGKNPNVPSLLNPYTTTKIFCTDCHNNDDFAGPRGPHGSNNRYLLRKSYTTQDMTTESSTAYALCYECHSRASILGDQSFKEHKKHIVDKKAPCSACHDPHGISSTQGNFLNNSHLINFDVTIVLPDDQGRLRFEDQGTFKGRCYLTCHGKNHNPEGY